MAKLYFRFGAMNSGKSTGLLQAAFNYEERGQRVLLAKPDVDTKGDSDVVSRLGMTRSVDFLVPAGASARELFTAQAHGDDPDALLQHVDTAPVACLLVDEAQFLEPEQVDDLFRIAVLDNVPVLAYGIRTDFRTRAFPGSLRLLEIAHTVENSRPSAVADGRLSSTPAGSGTRWSSTGTRLRSTARTSGTSRSAAPATSRSPAAGWATSYTAPGSAVPD